MDAQISGINLHFKLNMATPDVWLAERLARVPINIHQCYTPRVKKFRCPKLGGAQAEMGGAPWVGDIMAYLGVRGFDNSLAIRPEAARCAK